ncbi:MAG TPA: hypothetical protein VLT60_00460 [Usitatibacter sp.]|nr:hypothetical protein [Usitatibacter sp.]
MAVAIGAAALLPLAARAAEETFDACDVFTSDDAEKVLGVAAAAEPVNPKVKRPKVILACTYTGFKDSKPVAATVQFKFGRTDDEAQRAFEDARLQFQTKPLLISGAECFWSSKTGQLNLRKGRAWATLSVGSPKVNERDMADAKKLAEILVKKM